METAIDYGYEEHIPGPRSGHHHDDDDDDDHDCGYGVVTGTTTPGTSAFGSHTNVGVGGFPCYNRRGSIGSPFAEEDDDDIDEDGDDEDDDDDFIHDAVANMTTHANIDATEVSQSPSHNGCYTVTFDLFQHANDYPPMPADRQARKQRSFLRRGGAVHSSLLKSAVMASMMDFDSGTDDEFSISGGGGPNRRNMDLRRDSSISLQSLQDALHAETSPRKRARRRRMRGASDTDDDDEDANSNGADSATGTGNNMKMDSSNDDSNDSNKDKDVNEASHLFDTMRMGNHNLHNGNGSAHAGRSVPVRKDSFKREPPPRRVSRKTSYDSRVSDFDSDCGSDWED